MLAYRGRVFGLGRRPARGGTCGDMGLRALLGSRNVGCEVGIVNRRGLKRCHMVTSAITTLLNRLGRGNVHDFFHVRSNAPILCYKILFRGRRDPARIFTANIGVVDSRDLRRRGTRGVHLHIGTVSLVPGGGGVGISIKSTSKREHALRACGGARDRLGT